LIGKLEKRGIKLSDDGGGQPPIEILIEAEYRKSG
jgi:hypothetical protein